MKTRALIQLSMLLMIFYSCDEGSAYEKPSRLSSQSLSSPPPNAKLVTNYSFNGTEGDPLDFSIAQNWISNYQKVNPKGNHAHFFGNALINQILAENGCVGIRMYYALDNSGERKLLLVGVDVNGNDLLPSSTTGRTEDGDNIVGDMSYPCPTYCSGGG